MTGATKTTCCRRKPCCRSTGIGNPNAGEMFETPTSWQNSHTVEQRTIDFSNVGKQALKPPAAGARIAGEAAMSDSIRPNRRRHADAIHHTPAAYVQTSDYGIPGCTVLSPSPLVHRRRAVWWSFVENLNS